MEEKTKSYLVFLGITLAIGLGMFVLRYNGLQVKNENVNSKWAQVENQLQRRYELIPNLVAVVKQYSDYEASTLTEVVQMRSDKGIDTETEVDSAYQDAMKEFKIQVENYPELKASEEYSNLMIELAGTDNRIAVARMDYNNAIQSLNASINTFPTNIIANMTGIRERQYFEADEAATSGSVDVNALFEQ